MSFLDKLSALMPFGKKAEVLDYYFALSITSEKVIAALWTIESRQLKILDISEQTYSSLDNLTQVADKLLDAILGIREIEPQKILFGVPNSWLLDENLKDESMQVLKQLVKELDLKPMAYVENSSAIVHFLEKSEDVPPTAILVGFEPHHLTVSVVRAGKLDGVKVISRANLGSDIEKALLSFTSVETLPSKILIYGSKKEGLKDALLSFNWMQKLSFLHFPRIETLPEGIEIKSVCLAGASEIDADAKLFDEETVKTFKEPDSVRTEEKPTEEIEHDTQEDKEDKNENLGFMVGDIAAKSAIIDDSSPENIYSESLEQERSSPDSILPSIGKEFPFKKFIPKKISNITILSVSVLLLLILGAYLFLPVSEIKIFVEPKILEKETTVTADPSQKEVSEDSNIISGQIIETQIVGSGKANATGKREIGDPAKGTVVIYNKTFDSKSFSKGTVVSSSNGLKFALDSSVSIASASATDTGITFGNRKVDVTAQFVGADGNLPSGSDLTVANFSASQVTAKAEGNFSGGTSKEVTVVSSDDQNRLLAQTSSDLRRQAQQELQETLPEKRVLEEALSETIVRRSFSKNIGDQASEFSLDLTAKYKGTAFDDKDLKLIVSKLVVTDVPEGFELALEDTEALADVAKLEADGKLTFLAKFKAKLLPKIDTDEIKNKLRGKSATEAINLLKGMENILDAEIRSLPPLPSILQRIPLLTQNIKIEVGLK